MLDDVQAYVKQLKLWMYIMMAFSGISAICVTALVISGVKVKK